MITSCLFLHPFVDFYSGRLCIWDEVNLLQLGKVECLSVSKEFLKNGREKNKEWWLDQSQVRTIEAIIFWH